MCFIFIFYPSFIEEEEEEEEEGKCFLQKKFCSEVQLSLSAFGSAVI